MKKILYSIILTVICCHFSIAQVDTNRTIYTYEVIDGDTVPILQLRPYTYKDPEWEKEWRRTVFFTRRVYPYALIIDSIITSHEATIAELEKQSKSKRKIRKHNKKLKKTLKEEYGLEIRNMSVTRGEYLGKLLHKENGQTIYELIKKYKSGASAFWWHMIMKLYGGANLKTKYNHQYDWMLALVIKEIEAGKIKVIPREVQKQELLKSKEKKK